MKAAQKYTNNSGSSLFKNKWSINFNQSSLTKVSVKKLVSKGHPKVLQEKPNSWRCYKSFGSSHPIMLSIAVITGVGSTGYDSNQTCIHWTINAIINSKTKRSSFGMSFKKGKTICGRNSTSIKMGLQ